MDVVVTGATGHLGANVVRALLENNARVRTMVFDKDQRAIEGLPVERVTGDVRDPEAVRRALAGKEVVFHLAGMLATAPGRQQLLESINITGVRTVAAAALACGVRRLVHVSSVHAFVPGQPGDTVDEGWPKVDAAAKFAYDRSKAQGEREVAAAVERGLDAVVINPTSIIGPWDFAPSRMGQYFIRIYEKGLPLSPPGGFDWVDVRDVAASAVAAARHGRRGESYIVSGHWASVRELATIALESIGGTPPRGVLPGWVIRGMIPLSLAWGRLTATEPAFSPEIASTLACPSRFSCEKAARELQYRPRPLKTTIEDVYAWFVERGILKQRHTPNSPSGKRFGTTAMHRGQRP